MHIMIVIIRIDPTSHSWRQLPPMTNDYDIIHSPTFVKILSDYLLLLGYEYSQLKVENVGECLLTTHSYRQRRAGSATLLLVDDAVSLQHAPRKLLHVESTCCDAAAFILSFMHTNESTASLSLLS